jgi:hypothetical protein
MVDLEATDWTDEQLDRLATVEEEDVQAARALWRSVVPGPMKELLDAEEANDA